MLKSILIILTLLSNNIELNSGGFMIIQRQGFQRINKEGLQLIKDAEGFSSKIYECPGGVRTIGYGHAIQEGEEFKEPISQDEADLLLFNDVRHAESAVRKYTKRRLTSNEFSALVSFAYNVGEGNFRSSTLLKYVNKDKDLEAACEFIRWRYANKVVLAGLVKRRLAEASLFLK